MSPFRRERYPADWDAISQRIRERAGWKCEQCGVVNHTLIVRSVVDGARYLVLDEQTRFYRWPDGTPIRHSEIPGEFPTWRKHTRVVLTVAHYPDRDPMNCTDDNLQALCQRCHLRLDANHHANNARITRRKKRESFVKEQGQLSFFDGVSAIQFSDDMNDSNNTDCLDC